MNVEYPDVTGRTYYAFEEPEAGALEDGSQQIVRSPYPIAEPAGGPEPKTGFWRRQFRIPVTRGQKLFDGLFGVILPVTCFFFDPIVFREHDGTGLLGGIRNSSYLLSFTAIMATMAWLLWGERLKWINPFLSGLFAVSACVALGIGMFLAPFSIFGLAFGLPIAALGFTPLFCSAVLLRNSVRAFRSGSISVERSVLLHSFGLAALASLVIPYLVNLW